MTQIVRTAEEVHHIHDVLSAGVAAGIGGELIAGLRASLCWVLGHEPASLGMEMATANIISNLMEISGLDYDEVMEHILSGRVEEDPWDGFDVEDLDVDDL